MVKSCLSSEVENCLSSEPRHFILAKSLAEGNGNCHVCPASSPLLKYVVLLDTVSASELGV